MLFFTQDGAINLVADYSELRLAAETLAKPIAKLDDHTAAKKCATLLTMCFSSHGTLRLNMDEGTENTMPPGHDIPIGQASQHVREDLARLLGRLIPKTGDAKTGARKAADTKGMRVLLMVFAN